MSRDRGSANQDVVNLFKSWGYEPTPIELAAFQDMNWEQGGAGGQMAEYISAVQTLNKAQANDPLKGFAAEQGGIASNYRTMAEGQFGKAEAEARNAPKLFGNLTPDQIDAYLAPLGQQYANVDAKLQGDASRRGVAGSSIEAQAAAGAGREFKQNVLNTGLQVGMSQQQQLLNLLYGTGGQYLGAAGQASGLQGGATGQISRQANDNATFMSQLPIYLRSQAMQEEAMRKANSASAGGGNLGSLIGGGIGAGAGFLIGGPVGGMLGLGIGSGLGGGIGNSINPASSGGYPTGYSSGYGQSMAIPSGLLMGRNGIYGGMAGGNSNSIFGGPTSSLPASDLAGMPLV